MELDLTILIPTLDEAESLPTVLRHVKVVVAELTPRFEILVVDGGSKDGTPVRAEAEGARVLRQTGRGFGAAVREGLAAARGRWVISMDGDGSHPAAAFRLLWERRESARLVIASRFVAGGSADMSFKRYWLSRLLNVVSRAVLALPVRDASSGLRLYDAAFMRALPLSADDFTIQQEALVRALGAGGAVEEIPFHYAPRLGGQSKASVPVLAVRYLRMLARLRLVRGAAEPAAFLAALTLAAAVSLIGLCWGLPDSRRQAAWGGPPAPEQARDLAERWSQLYRDIEASHRERASEEPVMYATKPLVVEPGWTRPPDALLASYRSFSLQTEHPDEKKSFIVLARMRPWRLEFQPLYVQYGGAFIYPLGAWLAGASAVGAAKLTPALEHYLLRPEDMGRLYLLGRLFVAALHVAGVAALWVLARGLAGWGAATTAAVLWALSPLALWQSHVIKPYAPSALWTILAALAAMRARPIAAGALAGLATATNITSAFFVVLTWRRLIAGGATALAVFVLFNPYFVFSYKDFVWELEVYSPQKLGFSLSAAAALARSAGEVVGWGPALMLLAGLAAGPRLLAAAVAGSALLVFLRFPLGGALEWRLYYPAVALAYAGGAAALWRLPRAARLLAVAVLLAEAALRAAPVLRDLARNDTRARAAAWIDANVPAGASIGLARLPDPATCPPFTFAKYRLVISPRLDQPADWYVVPAAWRPEGYELAAGFGAASPGAAANFANAPFSIYKRRSK